MHKQPTFYNRGITYMPDIAFLLEISQFRVDSIPLRRVFSQQPARCWFIVWWWKKSWHHCCCLEPGWTPLKQTPWSLFMFHLFRLPLGSVFPEPALLPLSSTSNKESSSVPAFLCCYPTMCSLAPAGRNTGTADLLLASYLTSLLIPKWSCYFVND